MKHAIVDILRRFLQGSRLEPDEVLWGLLIGALVLSSVHLLTMFATRWGQRGVTGKALVFSLMAHFAVLLAVVTVPLPFGIPGGGEGAAEVRSEPEHRMLIRSGSVDAHREAGDRSKDGAATAVWDRLPAADAAKLVQPQAKPSAVGTAKVDRAEAPVKPAKPKALELASLPENREAPPTPAPDQATPIRQTPKVPEIEAPKTGPVARSESQLVRLANRKAVAGTSVVGDVQRQASEPGSGQRSPSAASTESSLGPVPAPAAPQALAADGGTARPSARKAAPTPASAPVPEAVARGNPSAAADGASADPKRVSAALPEGRWVATVDRLRSSKLTDAEPKRAAPGATGYQPLDTSPPAPQVEGSVPTPLLVRRSAGVPTTYRLRKLSNRKANARQFGGNEQSERAVESSLRWLAGVQDRDGSWNAKAFGAGQVKVDEHGVDRDFAGRDADSGVTALAILAFLGAGYTHEDGQYADNLDRALRWLIAQQKADGNLGERAGHFAMMYCHGIATYAIAEAYGMQNDPSSNTMLREPLTRGVRFILDNQNPDGGWRYVKGQKSDMSIFGWQLMALKSAEIAGVNIPQAAKTKMVAFLRQRSLGENGGLAGYREDESPTASMTAEALFCKQMLGLSRENVASQEAVEYLLGRLPKRSQINEYYWYYGTLALHQYGGTEWQTWNGAVRDLLISEQQAGGEFAGSWDPVGPWARYGGRIYSTALSTLCLEVYYRFLPLYQMGNTPKD